MNKNEVELTTVTPEEEQLLIAPFAPPSGARDLPMRHDVIGALLSAAGYLLFQYMLTRLRLTNAPLLTAFSLVALIITLFFTVRIARTLRSPLWLSVVLVSSAAIMLPYALWPVLPIHTGPQQAMAMRVYRDYRWCFRLLPGSSGLLMICLAASFGALISRLVREVKLLLPVAVVLALVDLYVVFGGGLVTQAQSGNSPGARTAMAALTVPLTPRMPPGVHAPPPLAVGFADYMFIAVFFACFLRFGVPARRTFVILTGVLCAYMLIVVLTGLSLPALAPMAVVVIGCNPHLFRYDPDERKALLYAGILVAAILGVMLFLNRR